jgi:hypothetical protein
MPPPRRALRAARRATPPPHSSSSSSSSSSNNDGGGSSTPPNGSSGSATNGGARAIAPAMKQLQMPPGAKASPAVRFGNGDGMRHWRELVASEDLNLQARRPLPCPCACIFPMCVR